MRETNVKEPILTDTSPSGMIEAIESTNRHGWASLGASSRFEVQDRVDGLWFASGVPMPPFNGIVGARLTNHDADEVIDEAIAHFGARSLPFSWATGPNTTPGNLGERLVAHGFKAQEAQAGMAIDLESVPDSVPMPDGLEIERVSGKGFVGDYGDVVSAGFGLPPTFGGEFARILAEATEGPDANSWGYLGRVDGKAVATSGVVLAGGGALIVNVVTLPEARGKGVGAAMTHRPLLEARGKGYRIGTLEATAMGYPVYKRLGFEEYCRVREYVWTPPDPE
jgi:GNAT superfamily N-acetyltransferase